MPIYLANPRGFCAGVNRAIEIVERALSLFDAPVYVRHEVVHNKFVVDKLRDQGAVFIEDLEAVPEGAILIFSAHGVARAVREEAGARRLRVFDATCPLVTKVHMEVVKHQADGRECILIGHAGHPEVEGTLGQYPAADGGGIYLVEAPGDVPGLQVKRPDRLAYVTQTTLSMDDTLAIVAALRARFPTIVGPKKDDICYATQNRQDAVKVLAACCEVVLVVGSRNSSNSNRLREIVQRENVPAYLIDNAEEIDRHWLDNITRIGVTAGASVPEHLVQGVIRRLCAWGGGPVEALSGREEHIVFSLPRELLKVGA